MLAALGPSKATLDVIGAANTLFTVTSTPSMM